MEGPPFAKLRIMYHTSQLCVVIVGACCYIILEIFLWLFGILEEPFGNFLEVGREGNREQWHK